MITKDTSLYSELFAKANELLEYSETSDKYISNIDEYFQNLGYIRAALEEQGIKNDISYFMLPIDEPLFEINADTREITIPNEFAKGISVQGDEVAETVYFSIDRYYDTTDFYDDYIIPVVQWKYAKDTGTNAYHLSATNGKIVMEDLSSKTGGTIKVVFGWPITSDVTERAENIQFSVRFYTIVDDAGNLITEMDKYSEGTLEYSFSTLNAITKISPSLDVQIDEGNFNYHNKNHLLWQRMRNSKPADLNLQAIAPIIDYYAPAAGSSAELNEDGYLTLAVKAVYPSGTVATRLGQQLYEVYRIDHSNNEELYSSGIAATAYDAVIDNENFGIDYIPVNLAKEKSRNSTVIYYRQVVLEDGTIEYVEYNDNLIEGLYKRVYTYNVDKAGKYYVKVTNILNDTNFASNKTGTFEISLPAIPTVGVLSDKYDNYILRYILNADNNIVLDDNGNPEVEPVVLKLTAIDNDEGNKLTYKWFRADNANETPSQVSEERDTLEYEATLPGYYYLEAINFKNNESVPGRSEIGIRVTYPADKPAAFRYYWGNTKDYQLDVQDKDTIAPGVFTVVPEAMNYDSFQYEWYQKGEDKTILSSTDTIALNDSHRGNVYYCKVSSIYNGDKSVAVSTREFTVQ